MATPVEVTTPTWASVSLTPAQQQAGIAEYDRLGAELQQIREQRAELLKKNKKKDQGQIAYLATQEAIIRDQMNQIARLIPTVVYQSNTGTQNIASYYADRVAAGEMTPTQAAMEYSNQYNQAMQASGQTLPAWAGGGTSSASMFDAYEQQLGRPLTDEEKSYLTANTLGTPTPYDQQQLALSQQNAQQANALSWAQLNADQQYRQQQLALSREQMAANIADSYAARRLQSQMAGGRWALPSGQMYGPGFEPGGAMQQLFERGGLSYTPQQVVRQDMP